MDYGFLAALFAMSAFECAGQSSQPSVDVVQTSQGYTIRITIPNSTTVAQPNCAVPLAPPPLVPPPQLCPPPLPPPVLVEPRRSGAAQVTVNVTIDGSGLPQQASPRPVAPDRGKVFCFRDLQVELRSLRLVDGNLVLTMSFSNLNAPEKRLGRVQQRRPGIGEWTPHRFGHGIRCQDRRADRHTGDLPRWVHTARAHRGDADQAV